MQALFQNGVPTGCSVFRMEADAINLEAAAQRYADLLPDSVDVLLLGVGVDGHVASLFPNNVALQERRRRVLLITGPKPPFERLTITPEVITRARSVFVLATGSAKAVMLSAALKNPNDFVALPARLTLGGTWLMDYVQYHENNSTYQKNKVLEGINLTIHKGEKVGFVGESGSGKSTLVDLIIGLYRPRSGKVKIDDMVLDESNLQNWRSQIGHIPQQVYLSDGTIKDNVCFGR